MQSFTTHAGVGAEDLKLLRISHFGKEKQPSNTSARLRFVIESYAVRKEESLQKIRGRYIYVSRPPASLAHAKTNGRQTRRRGLSEDQPHARGEERAVAYTITNLNDRFHSGRSERKKRRCLFLGTSRHFANSMAAVGQRGVQRHTRD